MIGIDVGGANLKIVDESGVHIHYCPLWKESPLAEIIAEYKSAGADNAAVVMSGELADGFFDKNEGIAFIVDAVKRSFPNAVFYGMDGKFHGEACRELAAANWLASVSYLKQQYPNAMMLDIGSTTADIVPFADFEKLIGMTDTLRL
ncbi:MAG: H4MPT-linked C1 transfer pathway protein, partial [Methanocorpusculum sp.]|nr:H4MPT-linked C1 transfer pathway protein [Methanocorpusculum sp.]